MFHSQVVVYTIKNVYNFRHIVVMKQSLHINIYKEWQVQSDNVCSKFRVFEIESK